MDQASRDMDKLMNKLADWLLYNHEAIKAALIEDARDNGVKAVAFGDVVAETRSERDLISQFISVIDTRKQLIDAVQHVIHMLDFDRWDMYVARYCEHMTNEMIIEERKGLHIYRDSLTETFNDIRGKLWDELTVKEFSFEDVIELRRKYPGIPGKKRPSRG